MATRQKITTQHTPDYRDHSKLIWETSTNVVKTELYLMAQP